MPVRNNPTVSVIVPNYNYAHYLPERIESILNQTFVDFEIILLDDASTDNSVEILESYRMNRKVSCLDVNVENSGKPFAQWKKGVSMARGKYIWIAESDDLADSEFLNSAISLLEEHSEASFCFLGAQVIDGEGRIRKKEYDRWEKRHKSYAKGYNLISGQAYVARNLYWKCYVYNASGVVFRRTCYSNIQDSDCFSMRYCGDWLFWTQMALQGDVIEVYRKLNYFRKHSASVTVQGQRAGASLSEDMDVIKYIEELIPVSRYKQMLRHGKIYKRIRRLKVEPNIKQELYLKFYTFWKMGKVGYWMERVNKILGYLIVWLNREKMERC